MSKTSLFSEFPEVSPKAWKQKIQVDLKGADYNEALVWESLEGIKVKPFYHAEDLEQFPSFHQSKPKKWKIGQTIYVGNTKTANKKVHDALSRGAEVFVFTIPSEEISIKELLSGVDLNSSQFHFNFQFLSFDYIKKLWDITKEQKENIFLNIDIIGNLARKGNWFQNLEKDHEQLSEIQKLGSQNLFSIDTSLYQNAGANIIQQLAYGLAHANEYLNHMADAPKTSHTFCFKLAVGSNYFFEIAKIRALRLLWKTLSMEYGIHQDCHIVAFPTKRNKTIYDYNVNMLRTTTECMSAILGGADTVINQPYDGIYNKDNEFGERIARNQLLLLKHESYFNEIENPAEGCYYIENLTQQLAEKALDLFKNIESSGGFLKQMRGHTIQKKIKESAQKEQQLFDNGELTLVGTNKYQNPDDRMKSSLELYPFVKTNTRKTLIEPIIEKRLAETLEQKRLQDE